MSGVSRFCSGPGPENVWYQPQSEKVSIPVLAEKTFGLDHLAHI
jgi:hypothetical protein